MSYLSLNGTRLYYEEKGEGQPIIFIHGVWMSGRFFKKQVPYFARSYRVIVPDLRSHGRSAHVHFGHTLAGYARDIHALIAELSLKNVVLIGWSMGALVTWDYFKQFGSDNVTATVIIDQSACDLTAPDWTMGLFDLAELRRTMADIQTDRETVVRDFIPSMFKDKPAEEEAGWIFDEITRLPESVAGAILFDQTLQDYRPVLPSVNVPTLLCFGRDEKLYPVAAGEYLCRNLPDARLVVFEESGHCPFLEEPERFNREVDRFIQSLR
ncbi:MAG: alpha/beta hydrolase [Dehalococcoidales bacterium]|nr:alpha/beta hydrolase [Dehalococcoidales bacterium]